VKSKAQFGYIKTGYGLIKMRRRVWRKLSELEIICLLEDLDKCVRNLPIDQMEVVELLSTLGWSIRRTADALRRPPGQVVGLWRQAGKQVANEMLSRGWTVA